MKFKGKIVGGIKDKVGLGGNKTRVKRSMSAEAIPIYVAKQDECNLPPIVVYIAREGSSSSNSISIDQDQYNLIVLKIQEMIRSYKSRTYNDFIVELGEGIKLGITEKTFNELSEKRKGEKISHEKIHLNILQITNTLHLEPEVINHFKYIISISENTKNGKCHVDENEFEKTMTKVHNVIHAMPDLPLTGIIFDLGAHKNLIEHKKGYLSPNSFEYLKNLKDSSEINISKLQVQTDTDINKYSIFNHKKTIVGTNLVIVESLKNNFGSTKTDTQEKERMISPRVKKDKRNNDSPATVEVMSNTVSSISELKPTKLTNSTVKRIQYPINIALGADNRILDKHIKDIYSAIINALASNLDLENSLTLDNFVIIFKDTSGNELKFKIEAHRDDAFKVLTTTKNPDLGLDNTYFSLVPQSQFAALLKARGSMQIPKLKADDSLTDSTPTARGSELEADSAISSLMRFLDNQTSNGSGIPNVKAVSYLSDKDSYKMLSSHKLRSTNDQDADDLLNNLIEGSEVFSRYSSMKEGDASNLNSELNFNPETEPATDAHELDELREMLKPSRDIFCNDSESEWDNSPKNSKLKRESELDDLIERLNPDKHKLMHSKNTNKISDAAESFLIDNAKISVRTRRNSLKEFEVLNDESSIDNHSSVIPPEVNEPKIRLIAKSGGGYKKSSENKSPNTFVQSIMKERSGQTAGTFIERLVNGDSQQTRG